MRTLQKEQEHIEKNTGREGNKQSQNKNSYKLSATGNDLSSAVQDAMAAAPATGVSLEVVVAEVTKTAPTPDALQRRMQTYVDRRVRKLSRKIEKGERKLIKMKNEKKELTFDVDAAAPPASGI